MIRFSGRRGERKLIGIGLSKDEVTRLLAGERITFKLEQLGLPAGDVLLFAGENEAQMHRDREKIIGTHIFAPTANISVDPLLTAKDINYV